jgi:hypothetical protein
MHVMLIAAATVLLLVFAALAAIDGVVIHLLCLRLHARERSWGEHVWHTASAVLFAPILVTVFLAPTAGVTLWVGVALLLLLYVVEIFDVQAERASRAELGGLGRSELALHVGAVVTRTLATVLALASRPLEAWSIGATSSAGPYPGWVGEAVSALVPGSLLVAAAHVALAWRHRPAAPPAALAA